MSSTEHLPQRAQDVLERYLKLPLGIPGQGVPVPYFNNRRSSVRAGLRATIGKGNPNEIIEEAEILARRENVDLTKLDGQTLTRFLVDHNLGIDCSGFAYHVLRPLFVSSSSRSFFLTFSGSPIRKLIALIRPAENASVRTFANKENSRQITTAEVRAGDVIIRLASKDDRKIIDHIMIVESVERNEVALPLVINYAHSIAWNTDGMYKHGVRRGSIKITKLFGTLTEQTWTEQGKTGEENETFVKACASETSLHRITPIESMNRINR